MYHLLKQNVWPGSNAVFLITVRADTLIMNYVWVKSHALNFVFATCNKDRVDMHSQTNMR